MKKQRQRIIHLDDMLLYIVKQWKIFLAGAVLVGVIFGVIGGYKVHFKYSEDSKKENKVAVNVSGSELDDVETVLYLEQAIKNQREYNENSILMRVNPVEKKIASVKYRFYISGKINSEFSSDLLEQGEKAYQNILSKDSFFEFIKKELRLKNDTKYLKELITTDTDSVGIIIFNVTAPNEQMASDICAELQKYLSDNNSEILKGLEGLKVQKDSENIVTATDMNLQNIQTNYYNSLQNMRISLDTRKAAMSNNAKEYLELSRASYEEGTYESGQTFYKNIYSGGDASLSRKVYETILYAVKRVVLFVGLFIILIAIKYMWSTRLMYAYDLQDMYGIRIIDILSTDEKARVGAVSNKIAVCVDGSNEVVLLSSNDMVKNSASFKALLKELQTKGISVHIFEEGELFQKQKVLKTYGNIIMVENIGESRYSKLESMLENIECFGINIAGAVVIKERKRYR